MINRLRNLWRNRELIIVVSLKWWLGLGIAVGYVFFWVVIGNSIYSYLVTLAIEPQWSWQLFWGVSFVSIIGSGLLFFGLYVLLAFYANWFNSLVNFFNFIDPSKDIKTTLKERDKEKNKKLWSMAKTQKIGEKNGSM